jgi:hypothetical protein
MTCGSMLMLTWCSFLLESLKSLYCRCLTFPSGTQSYALHPHVCNGSVSTKYQSRKAKYQSRKLSINRGGKILIQADMYQSGRLSFNGGGRLAPVEEAKPQSWRLCTNPDGKEIEGLPFYCVFYFMLWLYTLLCSPPYQTAWSQGGLSSCLSFLSVRGR